MDCLGLASVLLEEVSIVDRGYGMCENLANGCRRPHGIGDGGGGMEGSDQLYTPLTTTVYMSLSADRWLLR
jgi:hypothetical protein